MVNNYDFPKVYWHQKWELAPGIFTPGHHDIAELADRINLPLDLKGKRVLDIGAWNGALSFECARRGAEYVLAIGPENPEQTGFYWLRDTTGLSNVEYMLGSVYNLAKSSVGKFDIVLFCGVLYHLRYPILALDQIARICTDTLYIETEIDESLGVDKPIWKFHRLDDLNEDYSNWFTPNSTAVIEAAISSGFSLNSNVRIYGTRGTFCFSRTNELPEWRTLPTGEGEYYQTLVRDLFEK